MTEPASEPAADGGEPIIRIVRMTLAPDAVDAFLAIFDEAAPRIRASGGCRHLALLRDVRYANIVTTYSIWDSEEALDRYRRSSLFTGTWNRTRTLFAAPAEAWSHAVIRDVRKPG